ncbi:MAG TPA: response regulator [Stellaceae bacterium]|nr:response regulator [Stellaceae bacterium]
MPPRILIVEDNELNLKLLHDVLEAHGYVTIAAREGAAGVALAHDSHPDMILLDLQLPDISGYEAVRQLKDDPTTQAIPVVAVTAFAMVGDERKALAAGCDAYIAKPIVLREFLALVARFAGRPPQGTGQPDDC